VATIGIDIGGRSHALARCRDGEAKADREIVRVSQSRAGFAALDAWLDRQAERVTLVTMESSGHYWMPLAAHLRRRDVPVAVVNPLAAKYFARSRLARTKSDPADARSLAEMAMRDQPVARDPLAGAELRQAARFAMTLVTEQAKVCQRLIRLVDLGFPELGELFDDPTCRTAREVLRIAPTAQAATRRRTVTLANANAGPGHRRLGTTKAERLQAAAADSIAVPELDAEVAFEVRLLLDQFDLLERQIETADARVAGLLDGETARRLQTIPGVGPSIAATLLAEIGDIDRFTDFDQLLAYAGVHPAERKLRSQGRQPRDRLAHEQGWQQPPPRRGLSDGRRRRPAQPGHRRPLRAQASGRQIEDECPRPLHAQGAQHRLGRLAQRSGLRPQLGARGLTRLYGI
jgi:transposase